MGDHVRRAMCTLIMFLVVQFAIGAGLVGDVSSASPIILETIRGGRHPGYASIVFQFDDRAFSETPVVRENEVVFKLKNVETGLVPFRQYKSFDSWVMLEKAGTDLNVRIGLPENFSRMAHFLMENPDRLVINLHEKEPSALSWQGVVSEEQRTFIACQEAPEGFGLDCRRGPRPSVGQ